MRDVDQLVSVVFAGLSPLVIGEIIDQGTWVEARADSGQPVILEGRGIPLAVPLTGGNRHDSTQLFALLDAKPRVRGRGRGRPRSKPKTVYADRAYDFPVQPHKPGVCRKQ